MTPPYSDVWIPAVKRHRLLAKLPKNPEAKL